MNIKSVSEYVKFGDVPTGTIFIKKHELETASHNRHYLIKTYIDIPMVTSRPAGIDLSTGLYCDIGAAEDIIIFEDVDLIVKSSF